jgi:hypothetical protein
LAELNFVDTIYHGLPEKLLRAKFLGRFTPEKGPHVAIRLVRQAHLPLRIAATAAADALFQGADRAVAGRQSD